MPFRGARNFFCGVFADKDNWEASTASWPSTSTPHAPCPSIGSESTLLQDEVFINYSRVYEKVPVPFAFTPVNIGIEVNGQF